MSESISNFRPHLRAIAIVMSLPVAWNAPVHALGEDPSSVCMLTVDGGTPIKIPLTPIDQGNGTFQYNSSLSQPGQWDLTYNVFVSPDPAEEALIAGLIQIRNVSSVQHEYRCDFMYEMCPHLADSFMGGSCTIQLISNAGGGQISLPGGDSVWRGMADETTARTLFDGPFFIWASGQGVASSSQNFGTPIPSADGPPVERTSGLRLHFFLTDGDTAKFTSNFTLTAADDDDLLECEDQYIVDINGDGVVGFLDMLAIMNSWGKCGGCPADVNGDGDVGTPDLIILLAAWAG